MSLVTFPIFAYTAETMIGNKINKELYSFALAIFASSLALLDIIIKINL